MAQELLSGGQGGLGPAPVSNTSFYSNYLLVRDTLTKAGMLGFEQKDVSRIILQPDSMPFCTTKGDIR